VPEDASFTELEAAMTITRPAVQDMSHHDWMAAAAEEYRRLGALLSTLSAEDWTRPTDCAHWDVRQVVAHLVGAAEFTATVREQARQAWSGRRLRAGGPLVDGINAVQVRERADAPPDQLLRDLADAGARGLRRRERVPALLRAIPLPFGPPIGTKPLGYLMDRIYTRDAWMHRFDIARATDRAPHLTADHDGRLVADVVAEWASVHRKPFRLTLTGPAGGTWSVGSNGEETTRDAVEFCRILSGRAAGAGLLAHSVPF
jgi:uncharacterized protein (TIGR03083 family)